MAYAVLPCLIAAGASESPELPPAFRDYADIFLETNTTELPPIKGRQHLINLKEGEEPPYGLIYALSATELKALREYLNT
jgi:hypothetical protein